MALHNTQCPHCFTTYVISDEQLRVSEGMVRCGTCRERFQARLIPSEEETPRFDPREAFIEPLTEDDDSKRQAAAKILEDASPQEFSFADPHTDTESSISLSDVSESVNSDLSLDIDDDAPSTPVDSNQLSAEEMLANIRAKQQRQKEQQSMQDEPLSPSTAKPVASETSRQKPGQQELALPTNDVVPSPSSTNAQIKHADKQAKEKLIDQVDSLVENKLMKASTAAARSAAASSKPKPEAPFQLDRKPKKQAKQSAWLSWLLSPLLVVLVLLLGVTLVYQLWMKQIVVFEDDSFAQKTIVELSVPVADKLAEHDIELPMRRNLSQLELASARTEAHPTRSSTTLLRISIINHAEIEQPLPWLEMTLIDTEGKLVSRRNLSPRDYVYQNATNDLIGARELKKVTIELLSFPKQATGYELKILDK